MRYKYIMLMAILLLAVKVEASPLDTASMILNAKMNLVKFNSGNLSAQRLHKIIDAQCNYQFVQSRGFDDIVFFKIGIDFLDRSDSFNKVTNMGVIFDTFYFGYNTINSQLYRMKGFLFNDFDDLCVPIRMYGHGRYLKSSKVFAENYAVEGVDLKCLYLSHKKIKKLFRKLRPYECIRPAREVFTGATCTRKDMDRSNGKRSFVRRIFK